ncbi:unnamed protein product, partial [Mesorhabditis spiculigera]
MWASRCLRLPKKPFAELDYARNMPKEYVKRVQRAVPKKVWGDRFGAPDIVRWNVHPDDVKPSNQRPWEEDQLRDAIKKQNEYHKQKVLRKFYAIKPAKVKRMPDQEWTFFPGDIVEVKVGKDKRRQGTICRVSRDTNEVFVDGLHTKLTDMMSKENAERLGVDQQLTWSEQALSVEKGHVQLVDPNDNEPCTASWKLNGDEWIRISDRTGYEIPIPAQAEVTYDYVQIDKYIEADKDTPADEVLKITYQPQLASFEDEITKAHGAHDERKPQKTYWY